MQQVPSVVIDPEFAALIPPLTAEELRQLEDNLVQDGCRDALVVWNGLLLDGHNRYRICTQRGLQFQIIEIDLIDRNAAMIWIIDNQFGRRNLAPFTRGELALKRKPLIEAQARQRQRYHGGTAPGKSLVQNSAQVIDVGKTREAVAKVAGLSHDTLAKIELIAAHADEPTKAKLRADQVSVNRVAKEIKDNIRKEARKAELDAAPTLVHKDCRIITADFQDMAQDIPDGSIDAIITDPPYPAEFLNLFAPMAKIAARTLKPGGSLLVMCGQSYLPEIIGALTDHLTYQWTFAYMTPGAATTIYQRHVNCSWKPVLWFVKGEYKGRWIQDVLQSKERDKDFHEWGQSESGTAAMIEAVTEPSDIVFDPFVGGGTTAVVAAKLKRRFIGAEIDPEVAQLAQARIHEAIQ